MAAPEYPGAISASVMGTLARADMYPGGTYHGFFKHLVNLREVTTDGIGTHAPALATLFAYVTNHSTTAKTTGWLVSLYEIGASIYMPMFFARTSGSAGMLILLIIVVFVVPTVQAAPCPTCSDCLPGCTFSTNARACPFIASVAANTAIVAGGMGALNTVSCA